MSDLVHGLLNAVTLRVFYESTIKASNTSRLANANVARTQYEKLWTDFMRGINICAESITSTDFLYDPLNKNYLLISIQ